MPCVHVPHQQGVAGDLTSPQHVQCWVITLPPMLKLGRKKVTKFLFKCLNQLAFLTENPWCVIEVRLVHAAVVMSARQKPVAGIGV